MPSRSDAAQTTNLLTGAPPAWVVSVEWKRPAPAAITREGTRWLLYERQHNLPTEETFERVVLLMQNETGVQDAGSLSFDYDPSYEKLTLHYVRIHRGAEIIDCLNLSEVRTLQREQGLHDHIITGVQTALLVVKGLRVGDVLEYASTRRGSNPVLNGHFSARFLVQSTVPTDRQHFMVVAPSSAGLRIKQHKTDIQPIVSSTLDGVRYRWDLTNVTALAREDFVPASFQRFPFVETSDFESWKQVVDWALPLYSFPTNDYPAELHRLMSGWKGAASREEQARAALQFVQDDLRYTGLELGPDSYRPTPPFDTFEKRYGDCKGKAALLCTILREMGFQAWPVLVHSALQGAVTERLPSPFAFNHVIVKMVIEDRTIWVDPTISHQGGLLWNRDVPRYGTGLVVAPGVSDLEAITPQPSIGPYHHTTSTFDLGHPDTPVALTIKTTYRGAEADQMRERHARSEPSESQADYLNYYAKFYDGIQSVQPLQHSDDRISNVFTTVETYRITNFWKSGESKTKLECSFVAETLFGSLLQPTTRIRQSPMWLAYPLHREQEIVLRLGEPDWSIPEKTEVILHPAFSFRFHRKLTGATARYHFTLATMTNAVAAAQLPDYLAKREKVEELLFNSLERSKDGVPIAHRLNWLMVVVAFFACVAGLAGGIWLWRRSAKPVDLPPLLPGDHALSGLGGWLVLVGLGVCLSPVAQLVTLIGQWEGFFSAEVWQTAALPGGSEYHPAFGPLLIFEVIGNILLLAVYVVLVGLFFCKRRMFPRVYIAAAVTYAVILIIDTAAAASIPLVKESGSDSHRDVSRAVLNALIWGTYMVRSRRVKATFREPRPATSPPPVPPASNDLCREEVEVQSS